MARFGLLLVAPLLGLSGCTTGSIDTGWSRAPDLSIYSAMNHFGAVAREQAVLCAGRSPHRIDQEWQRDYGLRHEAVRTAMTARYGAAAIERARLAAGPRVPCEPLTYERWWDSYNQLLRLLELRMSDRSNG
jgi:hypothetical protein